MEGAGRGHGAWGQTAPTWAVAAQQPRGAEQAALGLSRLIPGVLSTARALHWQPSGKLPAPSQPWEQLEPPAASGEQGAGRSRPRPQRRRQGEQ